MIKNIVDRIADRTRWGYLLAFIILLISYIVSYVSAQRLLKQSNLVNHSNEVIHSLDNIISFVTQCESASRGYFITDRQEFADRYQSSRRKADSTFNYTKYLLRDNPVLEKKMDSLRYFMNDKFSWVENIFTVYDSTHTITKSFLGYGNEGIVKMIRVEDFTHHIQDEERKLWKQRTSEVFDYSANIKAFTIISLVVAILLTIYSILTFTKENNARREADQKASLYREQLEMRVNELASLNLELIELRNIEKFAATGRISRTIAHEVRNPLTNIHLAAEQLRNEIPPGGDSDLLFDMISRNCTRINQLISDLLNATRTSELNFVKTSINDVLDSSLEFAMDRIELKQISVVKNYDKNVCPVMVDVEKIKIAFLNIIVNAIEAMDDNGTLDITTQSLRDRCVVKISDNGRGMSKEDTERLFEPYFTTKQKGTGLGLTNTQNILLAHQAKINVETKQGEGTMFTITFIFAS